MSDQTPPDRSDDRTRRPNDPVPRPQHPRGAAIAVVVVMILLIVLLAVASTFG
ncbi:MAG: hypothetical protein M9952_00800 [Microthrixaceae bacterium]|nr:hypothetical protein [Microthrixaceae bacterium]MCO5311470.1 hypothetical protein [Microthrixaceae bacterium]HPB45483.1 hypothetical protein [Microthrixaceae bacterium]